MKKLFIILSMFILLSCISIPREKNGVNHLGSLSGADRSSSKKPDGPAMPEQNEAAIKDTAVIIDEDFEIIEEELPDEPEETAEPAEQTVIEEALPGEPEETAEPVENTLQNNIDSLYNTAMEQIKISDYSAAVSNLERILELDPSFNPAREKLGLVYFEQEKYQQALDVYGTILEQEPENPEGLLGMGSVYNAVHMHEESIPLIDSAISKLIKANSSETMQAYYIQGMNYYYIDDYENAYSLLMAIEDYYGNDAALQAALKEIRRKLQSGE